MTAALEPGSRRWPTFSLEILRRKLASSRSRVQEIFKPDYEKVCDFGGYQHLWGGYSPGQWERLHRERLFGIWDEAYTAHCKQDCRDEVRDAARFILGRNILCGNALTLKKVDANGQDMDEPIIFSEWTFTSEQSLKRSDYRLDVLMNENPDKNMYQSQMSLFAEDAMGTDNWLSDPDDPQKSIPKPVREFPPVYYWKVQCNE